MSLPASQYSVLDAERIERVDDNTFRCYVYRFKFFAFEVCPVLLVRVEEQPNGCCIKLLSCKVHTVPRLYSIIVSLLLSIRARRINAEEVLIAKILLFSSKSSIFCLAAA